MLIGYTKIYTMFSNPNLNIIYSPRFNRDHNNEGLIKGQVMSVYLMEYIFNDYQMENVGVVLSMISYIT